MPIQSFRGKPSDGQLFFSGGIVIGKKNCLHEKKCHNKLSAPEVHLEKNCLHRPPMLCKIWGILKNIVCTAGVEKKACKSSVDGGKNFLTSRNHDTPQGKIMVRPSWEST